MLTGLNHLTLAVRDVDRSVVFYRDLLGLRMEAQWTTGAYLSLGGLWLCLSFDDSKSEGVQPDYTHYAFSIDQAAFTRFTERMRHRGVVEWKETRSEGDSLYFLDPDGHKLEAHVGGLATRLAQCRVHPYPGMRFAD